jgi:TRAP-type C4-dicarboxylate transport system substrate-binding protein
MGRQNRKTEAIGGTMTLKAIYRLILGATLISVSSLAASAQPSPIVMKLGTSTLNDSIHEWAKIFAAHVGEDSGGRIKVEVYPGNQLGTSPRMIEQTQLGSIQGVAGAPEFLSGVDPSFQVLGAPGLFKNLAHTNRVLQDPEFNKAYLALGANKGLKGIGLMISGPTLFVSRKPIRKLADFKDLKTRVLAGRLQLAQIRKLGGSPVPMPLGEVLPALQQGALDSVMSCIPVFVALRYYDAAKYLVETNHGLIAGAAVISKLWFDKLPADLQGVVVKAGQKASNEVYQFSVDDVNRGRDAWIKNGGVVTTLEPGEQARLMREMAEVGALETQETPQEKAMYDLLRTVAARTAN